MQFITNNTQTIIMLITMVVTWILGALSKKSKYINNNLIIIQNIIIGLCASLVYYLVTKDFNLAITMSGIFAETGYNLIHNVQKLIEKSNFPTPNSNQNNNIIDLPDIKNP